ncbi:MAG: 7TM diverse intracellular signaling domain-containing protein [Polaromonas sp.]|uniref:sensor domain-containing diguanylate cyclase n=1 Tax=Polaromonas sp. TaxID=1869339 RepID=UPI0024879E7B|nr:7TM diverse intracellular signaling domain-containing protein [Polaromonas sp.]MDI1271716.1 7TM diverse intracellular signaling domain-containing protein [Polaromonas sp.]
MGAKRTFTAAGVLAAFARGLLAVLCLQSALLASPAAAGELLTLDQQRAPLNMVPALEFWIDANGQASVEKIEAGAHTLGFAPVQSGRPYALDNAALWLRFNAVVKDPQTHWKLELPMSGVDRITLYYRDSLGRWVVQQAGDSLPISAWPQPGRYPVFSLSHEVGQLVPYYLRVEHARIPFSALPRVVSDAQVTTARQLEHLLLGAYFGLAALVTVLALINATAYRDWGFATYALYVATFAGSQGAFSGVAGLYLWPELPKLNNISIVLLPLTAAAAALWFVRTVTTPKRFSRALDWFIVALMGLLPLVALIDAAFPTIESFALINILVSAGMGVVLMVVGVSLVEGDRHARWMALGFLPIMVATLFPLLRNFGVLASSFLTQNALMLGSAVEAPILFYGLLRRVTQRRESETRATALPTTDPLTGLGSARLLLGRLRQALRTAERYRQPCALLIVNLSNLASLQQQHGRETGDRAMVMAAACIRGAAQPTDTVARVGDSLFALLMEGPMSSDSVTQVATKILAGGLRPSRKLPEADPLLFHIAIGYVAESARLGPDQAQACLERMVQAVKDMDDGSRKAIRLTHL